MWAIQLVENFGQDEEAARLALSVLRGQDGFLDGRILAPSAVKPGWRVQAFFQDEPEAAGCWLPDGLRRVIIHGGLQGLSRLCRV